MYETDWNIHASEISVVRFPFNMLMVAWFVWRWAGTVCHWICSFDSNLNLYIHAKILKGIEIINITNLRVWLLDFWNLVLVLWVTIGLYQTVVTHFFCRVALNSIQMNFDEKVKIVYSFLYVSVCLSLSPCVCVCVCFDIAEWQFASAWCLQVALKINDENVAICFICSSMTAMVFISHDSW